MLSRRLYLFLWFVYASMLMKQIFMFERDLKKGTAPSASISVSKNSDTSQGDAQLGMIAQTCRPRSDTGTASKEQLVRLFTRLLKAVHVIDWSP